MKWRDTKFDTRLEVSKALFHLLFHWRGVDVCIDTVSISLGWLVLLLSCGRSTGNVLDT